MIKKISSFFIGLGMLCGVVSCTSDNSDDLKDESGNAKPTDYEAVLRDPKGNIVWSAVSESPPERDLGGLVMITDKRTGIKRGASMGSNISYHPIDAIDGVEPKDEDIDFKVTALGPTGDTLWSVISDERPQGNDFGLTVVDKITGNRYGTTTGTHVHFNSVAEIAGLKEKEDGLDYEVTALDPQGKVLWVAVADNAPENETPFGIRVVCRRTGIPYGATKGTTVSYKPIPEIAKPAAALENPEYIVTAIGTRADTIWQSLTGKTPEANDFGIVVHDKQTGIKRGATTGTTVVYKGIQEMKK